ncbi:hypothetical protein BOTCAL_0483g00020 [Botryotinia calthae]|uniref:DUF7924 domain-containing protein n=1 Tax=Botryotinia calthae TaxID=38488 RepID=A0A4Y8CLX7_9HELO|nr:hypothetical protein BOTCAL_0483g00020 [Botryotinia calthae]
MNSSPTLPCPVDMAPHQATPNTRNVGQPSLQKDQGKKPQGIKRKRSHSPSRKSAQPRPERATSKDRNTQLKNPLSSTTSDTAVGSSGKDTDPLEYWTKEFRWPKEYFEPESNMNHLLARKRSSSSLREKKSEASSATPSDQKPREFRSISYIRPGYENVLASKGSFMRTFELGITDESEGLCETLLTAEQSIPQDTLFRDDLFVKTCESVKSRNETMVIRDISLLICPSAQNLRIYGAEHLKVLNESVNEGWNNAISIHGSRPQPDYSVGFDYFAFTDDQFQKLKPFVGEIADIVSSYFMATWQMYFPFLTCEVKCGAAALDVADRQNAHSMTIAVRGIVELFRLGKREKELHREILGFSISHDHESVRIYGHYPVIDGQKTTFYRHPIRKFNFTELRGKEKWTAYKFTKNVYDIWMPTHFKRICSVIDNLPPNIDFEVGESGLSQGLENSQFSGYSNQDAESLPEEASSQASRTSSGEITPHTSVSERVVARASKKPRKRGPPVEFDSTKEVDSE